MSKSDGSSIPAITPSPSNMVCADCGSAEVECLDWVRVNDDYFIGGSECIPDDDYWCQACEIHAAPIEACEYCERKGHTGRPCQVCGMEA